jgi:DNA modification methylase
VGNGLILLDGEGASLYVQSKAPKNKKLRQVRITKDTSVYLTGSDRQDGTVWEVARDPNHEHPTQKPVELARRAIENSSKPGRSSPTASLAAAPR